MRTLLPLEQIEVLAISKGWEKISHQENIKMVSFFKLGVRVNIYYSTGSVATSLNHPIKGKTQLYRRGANMELLGKIFDNPRAHTGVGYYRKDEIR